MKKKHLMKLKTQLKKKQNFLSWTNSYYQKPTANTIFNGTALEEHSLKSEQDDVCHELNAIPIRIPAEFFIEHIDDSEVH